MKIEACSLPDGALLARYRDMPGAYTDCFTASVGREVSASEFIEAFYTTWLFKCERFVLFLIGHGCTDADARRLARGEADAFAAWTVEGRADHQLLVCDFAKLTRSWLMISARSDGQPGTQLYFGSAVVPTAKDSSGNPRPSAAFRWLQPVHAFYARALLRAAASKLTRQMRRAGAH
jgi:hypothetical protein